MFYSTSGTGYRNHRLPQGQRRLPAEGPSSGSLPALEKMLWGGTVMLIVDHIINGELTWRFPFFTALGQTGGFQVMLREMLTVGVPMSLVLTAVWVLLLESPSSRASHNALSNQ